ncbi:hypothetical protein GCM10020000_40570 [Streptomyces olivoverticillatus]
MLAPMSWAADDDKVLFTMDVVRGGSLAHLIGDYGPLPPHFVCVLLDQLLSGLTAVHAEGVVHRDIKPANLLLEATGTGRPHLRLSDFGIAMRKGEPRLTETNFVMGTPGYFAPEQMVGEEPDFPADLFAVGLVALYLLTGRKPDAEALVERFLEHGVPGPPEEVPAPLWEVIANLLQPDPYARFRTAAGGAQGACGRREAAGSAPGGRGADRGLRPAGPAARGFRPERPRAAAGALTGRGNAGHRPSGGTAPPELPAHTALQRRSALLPAAAATRGAAAPARGPYAPPARPLRPARGRPGPSPKVAVPVLLVALLCLAVGVWALTAGGW